VFDKYFTTWKFLKNNATRNRLLKCYYFYLFKYINHLINFDVVHILKCVFHLKIKQKSYTLVDKSIFLIVTKIRGAIFKNVKLLWSKISKIVLCPKFFHIKNELLNQIHPLEHQKIICFSAFSLPGNVHALKQRWSFIFIWCFLPSIVFSQHW